MWTAITLALIVGGGIVAYVAWAAHMVAGGAPLWPFVLGLPFAYLAAPLFFTSVWVSMGAWMRSPRPADVVLGWRQRVHLFAGEFAALSTSPPKMIFYRLLVRDPPPAPASVPVLLLHGVGCNAGVWFGMQGFLEKQGVGPVNALSYGPPLSSIETFADQVAQKVSAIRAATGAKQVVLVGHSMGGLVGLTYLRRHGGDSVRRLITIGTPFHGSRHAYMMFGQSLAQLRPGSKFLAGVDVRDDYPAEVRVVSLWSWHDSMVTPQLSARLDWADNIPIVGIAHNALIGDRGVWARVVDEIRKARAAQA